VLEVALKKKEEQYRNLTEITTDMILEVDCHGIIVYVNPQVYHVLGFHPPEVIGTVIWDFVVTEKRVSIKRFFSQNTGYQFEQVSIPLNHRNGSEVWVEFSGVPFFDENQQLSGYRGIGRDVTKSVAIETYNRRLQAIIESTPDIVRISDIKGDILYINKAGRKILNIPDETDITTLNNSDYMDPEDWSKILLGRQTAIENGIWQGITTLRATDGTKIPVSQVIIPHSTGKGDELIFSTVARDITEITQFQEILENDYLYTRSLIEANPDPLITIGSGGEIQDVNHATEQVTGYSREELIGTDFCTYFSDPKSARKGYKQVFSDGFVKNYPLEILHYDGHVSPVLYNATLYRDRSGAVQGVFAAARDISAIKNTEQQLAESRDYYLKILDNFPNPIWRSDTSAKCDYFNKAWLSFTGKTIKEEMGDGWVKGVHPEDLDRCIALYRSSFDQREPFFMIYRLLHNDGSYHRIADYGSPIFDVKGEFSGYIGSCYDLDEVEVQ
jgi:PAS domain S-box-containing protein